MTHREKTTYLFLFGGYTILILSGFNIYKYSRNSYTCSKEFRAKLWICNLSRDCIANKSVYKQDLFTRHLIYYSNINLIKWRPLSFWLYCEIVTWYIGLLKGCFTNKWVKNKYKMQNFFSNMMPASSQGSGGPNEDVPWYLRYGAKMLGCVGGGSK